MQFPSRPVLILKDERISPVRLFQEWLERDGQQVIAARSSFSISTGLFGITEAFDIGVNPDAPGLF